MAFDNVFLGVIAGGQTIRWGYRYSEGANRAAQYAMAHPVAPGHELQVNDQSKRIENDGSVTYLVTVRNPDTLSVAYFLEGGGLA